MKRLMVVLCLAMASAMFFLPAFAQDSGKMDPKMHEQMMQTDEDKTADMDDAGMMMHCSKMMDSPMRGMMMKSAMGKVMVATSDGGVVVLAGNKLMKFDKNLALTKEVEIKQDMEGMQKMMMQMCGDSPMCKKMKGGCMEQGTKDKPAETEMKAN